MSMPMIPNLDGQMNITRGQAKTLLLASIGMEELVLSHLLNAEAEKIQFALQNDSPCFDELTTINKSVQTSLKDIIKKEMQLEFKLEEDEEPSEGSPYKKNF